MNGLRVATVVRKEVREFRRNRFVVGTMAVMPFVFLITPMVTMLRIPDSAGGTQVRAAVGAMSLLMLIVPVVIPPVIAAYSVVGERDQGTLEPVLTTPVEASELLLGKAVAAFIPSVGVAYLMYFIAAISIRFGAAHVVSSVVWSAPQMVAQILFTPLLALWAIWVGIGISTRASDVRVAQQLATLAGLPLLAFTSLLSFQVLTPSIPLAVGVALALLAADIAAWRVVSRSSTANDSSPGRTEQRQANGAALTAPYPAPTRLTESVALRQAWAACNAQQQDRVVPRYLGVGVSLPNRAEDRTTIPDAR